MGKRKNRVYFYGHIVDAYTNRQKYLTKVPDIG